MKETPICPNLGGQSLLSEGRADSVLEIVPVVLQARSLLPSENEIICFFYLIQGPRHCAGHADLFGISSFVCQRVGVVICDNSLARCVKQELKYMNSEGSRLFACHGCLQGCHCSHPSLPTEIVG
jgi:hypothetical protein